MMRVQALPEPSQELSGKTLPITLSRPELASSVHRTSTPYNQLWPQHGRLWHRTVGAQTAHSQNPVQPSSPQK